MTSISPFLVLLIGIFIIFFILFIGLFIFFFVYIFKSSDVKKYQSYGSLNNLSQAFGIDTISSDLSFHTRQIGYVGVNVSITHKVVPFAFYHPAIIGMNHANGEPIFEYRFENNGFYIRVPKLYTSMISNNNRFFIPYDKIVSVATTSNIFPKMKAGMMYEIKLEDTNSVVGVPSRLFKNNLDYFPEKLRKIIREADQES